MQQDASPPKSPWISPFHEWRVFAAENLEKSDHFIDNYSIKINQIELMSTIQIMLSGGRQ